MGASATDELLCTIEEVVAMGGVEMHSEVALLDDLSDLTAL
jgi:hypothetical protein